MSKPSASPSPTEFEESQNFLVFFKYDRNSEDMIEEPKQENTPQDKGPALHNYPFPEDSYSSKRGSDASLTLPRKSSQAMLSSIKPSEMSKLVRSLNMFSSRQAKQNFSEQERETLSKFSSLNYAPSHSLAYMQWLQRHPGSAYEPIQRWALCLMIGVCTGLVACLLQQCSQVLGSFKWDWTRASTRENSLLEAFGWNASISIIFGFISSFLISFVHPPAAGGGTPEVIAFLNGILVHGALGIRNLLVKFISLVFTVSSGMACGTQGPLISYGAIIGSGIGQFQSKFLGISPDVFTRFRNAESRREFTTAGVAAGVAAGFNAPVGGLLFAMEDLSSFWGKRLSWQTFFCATVATAIAQLFNTAFTAFQFQGTFGLFTVSKVEPIQMHVASVVAAIALGLIGGILGAFFTHLNTFIGGQRKAVLAKIKIEPLKKAVCILEVLIIVVVMTAYSTFLPQGFPCKKIDITANNSRYLTQCALGLGGPSLHLEPYTCDQSPAQNDSSVLIYNDVASLVQGGGSAYLDQLWSTGTHSVYSWQGCVAIFVIWFLVTIYTSGTAVAGGIFLPVVISGALYGRALGVGMVTLWQHLAGSIAPIDTEWDWLDPGIIAVMGSASLLGGVTRLSLATTVIMVEMSRDIDLIIPLMITNFVAKLVADTLSKPLFVYQLDSKLLPFLAQEPRIAVEDEIANLELYKASDVMAFPVWTIQSCESVGALAKLLLDTDHEGFPVVKCDETRGLDLAYGLITRTELYTILCHSDVYKEARSGALIKPNIVYEQLSVDVIRDPGAAVERVRSYTKMSVYNNIFVDLEPFVNISAPKVDEDYSLHRTYQIFRTLGLRHLVVVDIHNQVVGIITRQDLLPFNMQERLAEATGSCEGHEVHAENAPPILETVSEKVDKKHSENGVVNPVFQDGSQTVI